MHELVADGTCDNGCCAIFQCAHCTYRCVQNAALFPVDDPADPDLVMLQVRRRILDVGDPAADHEGTVRLAEEAAEFGVPNDPLERPALRLPVWLLLAALIVLAVLAWRAGR
jgi:hypothetical protein